MIETIDVIEEKQDINDLENYKGQWQNIYFDLDGRSYSNAGGVDSDIFPTKEEAEIDAEDSVLFLNTLQFTSPCLIFQNGRLHWSRFSHVLTLPSLQND